MLRRILLSSSISLMAACANGPAPAPPPAPSLAIVWTPPTTNTDRTPIAGPLSFGVYLGACGGEKRAAVVTTPSYALTGSGCAYVTAIEGGKESAPSGQIAY